MNSANIYWTFSTAAQAIATFIGFLLAGFFFVYEKIAIQSEQDETLIDINIELHKNFHSILKTLLYLTASTIILCLFITFSNGYDWPLKWVLIIMCSLLIIVTISWAIYFVITVIDPEKFKKAANRISSKQKILFNVKKESAKSVSEFLMKFIELEKRLRKLAELNNMPIYRSVPLVKYIDYLLSIQKITETQHRDITELTRTRNYALHGQSTYIDNRLVESLEKILTEIEI